MIETHRDRVRLFPGEAGSRERCKPHQRTPGVSGRDRGRRLPEAHRRRSARLAMRTHRGDGRA